MLRRIVRAGVLSEIVARIRAGSVRLHFTGKRPGLVLSTMLLLMALAADGEEGTVSPQPKPVAAKASKRSPLANPPKIDLVPPPSDLSRRPKESAPEPSPPAGSGAQPGKRSAREQLQKIKQLNKLFSGRKEPMKSELIKSRGGTPESENAVKLGLEWIVAHQQSDGSWRFDHSCAPGCRERCNYPGPYEEVDNAATGLALLALLGAGHTHFYDVDQSPYADQIAAGLRILVQQAISRKTPGDLRGTWATLKKKPMYAQGIATLALCEAYGMTGDEGLQRPAELAVKFIVNAQGEGAGGGTSRMKSATCPSPAGKLWRSRARHAGIEVPVSCTTYFWSMLDRMEYDRGRQYGYQDQGQLQYVTEAEANGMTPLRGRSAGREAMTPTGLLARMWLRCSENEKEMFPALKPAVTQLIKRRPLRDNLYYDYYASQLFNQVDDAKWPQWNKSMRDFLVKVQEDNAHLKGSWEPLDIWGSGVGGRLYNTCLATMILEVYYRYLPLYERPADAAEKPQKKVADKKADEEVGAVAEEDGK